MITGVRARDPARVRGIVRRAAGELENVQARTWLLEDDRGTWERMAADYLERTAERAASLGLTPDQVDEQIAIRLAANALDALLADARKNR